MRSLPLSFSRDKPTKRVFVYSLALYGTKPNTFILNRRDECYSKWKMWRRPLSMQVDKVNSILRVSFNMLSFLANLLTKIKRYKYT